MRLSYPDCEPASPADTLTERLNNLLKSSGPGYILSLCPGQRYNLTAPLQFAAPNQEITTAGYPTDSARAVLVVDGPVIDGNGHTTAVEGICHKCDGVKLRNVQIDGMRRGALAMSGGASIEMGGRNAHQLVEHVRSFDPRGWSCLHVAQGNLDCTNITVQNNEFGPAGADVPRQWADGISVACRDSLIRNNMINNPTDGGIVLFGSPGTRVKNNTIWVETKTLLGGINLVDISPFGGDYRGVVVTDNTIVGGFASRPPQGSETKGTNDNDVIIKIGIAIGPRTWFGSRHGNNVSTGGVVLNNQFTGAFGYGIVLSSATNFTVEDNVLVGNTSFIGTRGPKCRAEHPIPSPAAFVMDPNNVQKSTAQSNFVPVTNGDSLVSCIVPPTGGDYWPFGGIPNPNVPTTHVPELNFDFGPLIGWHDGGMGTITIIPAALFAVLVARFLLKCPFKRSYVARLLPRYLAKPVWLLWQKVYVCLRHIRFRSDRYSNISQRRVEKAV